MKTILILDGNNKAWESGKADFIMSTYKWWNVPNGFKALVPKEFVL